MIMWQLEKPVCEVTAPTIKVISTDLIVVVVVEEHGLWGVWRPSGRCQTGPTHGDTGRTSPVSDSITAVVEAVKANSLHPRAAFTLVVRCGDEGLFSFLHFDPFSEPKQTPSNNIIQVVASRPCATRHWSQVPDFSMSANIVYTLALNSTPFRQCSVLHSKTNFKSGIFKLQITRR